MILVRILWNTEADGTRVPDDLDEEEMPCSLYGPFDSFEDAESWMNDDYPDGDAAVYDMGAANIEVEPDWCINLPSVIFGDEPEEDIRSVSQEIHGP